MLKIKRDDDRVDIAKLTAWIDAGCPQFAAEGGGGEPTKGQDDPKKDEPKKDEPKKAEPKNTDTRM